MVRAVFSPYNELAIGGLSSIVAYNELVIGGLSSIIAYNELVIGGLSSILLLQNQDSPSAKSRFFFCKIKILLLQNQDSPAAKPKPILVFCDDTYKFLASVCAPAGLFSPQDTFLDV